jgi:cytochrome b6
MPLPGIGRRSIRGPAALCGIAGIKPEWYFLFLFQTLKYIPAKVGFVDGDVLGVLVMGACAALWVFVPFLDRNAARGEKSPAFTAIGWVLIVYIVGMTLVGYFN